jgi:hypothetical protein
MRRTWSNAFQKIVRRRVLITLASPFVASIASAARAQEIEPRAYSANPLGVTFAGLSVLHSHGDVVLEPSSPLTDVNAKVYIGALALGGTFSLFGRTAMAGIGVPYAWAKVSGRIDEDARSVERTGLADTRVRFAINLLGGKAMALPEFVRRKPSTTLGTSLVVSIPTGQYFDDKLVNIGTNRWAFKPEIGLSHPTGPWTLELYGGAWFFTGNDSYLGNQRREQDPMLSLQSHVGYTIQPRLWIAADVTYYAGGRVVTNDVPAAERQDNVRVGVTTSLPVGRSNAVKLAWSRGAITRLGGNFDTWGIAWQTTHIRIPARKPAANR